MVRNTRLLLFFLILVLFLVLSPHTSPAVLASNPSPAQESRKITVLEGQAAIEKVAELTGMSVAEVEAMIARDRAIRQATERNIQPMGVGGFFADFFPECIYSGTAWGLFDTGPGPFSVQFSGSDIWGPYNGWCGGGQCTWLASANLDRPGDRIWVYSVNSIWANNISNWCSSQA